MRHSLKNLPISHPADAEPIGKMRLNVGAILVNHEGNVLLAQRINFDNVWQFPQGGIQRGESLEQALDREMNEELGITRHHYRILYESKYWYSYYFPNSQSSHYFLGQRQKWFLLQWLGNDSDIRLDSGADGSAEFSQWRWVSYWYPLHIVPEFKQHVYQGILLEMLDCPPFSSP